MAETGMHAARKLKEQAKEEERMMVSGFHIIIYFFDLFKLEYFLPGLIFF